MHDLSLSLFSAVSLAVVVKLMSHAAASTKKKLDSLNGGDPIVNFFAWIDRKTSFYRG